MASKSHELTKKCLPDASSPMIVSSELDTMFANLRTVFSTNLGRFSYRIDIRLLVLKHFMSSKHFAILYGCIL